MCNAGCVAGVLVAVAVLLVVIFAGGFYLAIRRRQLSDREEPLLGRDDRGNPIYSTSAPVVVDPQIDEIEIDLIKEGASLGDFGLNPQSRNPTWGMGVVVSPTPGTIASKQLVPPGVLTSVNDIPMTYSEDFSRIQMSPVYTIRIKPTAIIKDNFITYHLRLNDHLDRWGIECIETEKGLQISSIEKNSPAGANRIPNNVTLHSINSKPIKTIKDFNEEVMYGRVHQNKLVTLCVEYADPTLPDPTVPVLQTLYIRHNQSDDDNMGYVVEELPDPEDEENNNKILRLATDPIAGSVFDRAGLTRGCVIKSVAGAPIKSLTDLRSALTRARLAADRFQIQIIAAPRDVRSKSRNKKLLMIGDGYMSMVRPPPEKSGFVDNWRDSDDVPLPPERGLFQNPEIFDVSSPRNTSPVHAGRIEIDAAKESILPYMLDSDEESCVSSLAVSEQRKTSFRTLMGLTQNNRENDENPKSTDTPDDIPVATKDEPTWKPRENLRVRTKLTPLIPYTQNQRSKAGHKAIVKKIIVAEDTEYVLLQFRQGFLTWRWSDCTCVRHRLKAFSSLRPTRCSVCKKVIWAGTLSLCGDCGEHYHKSCGDALTEKGNACPYDSSSALDVEQEEIEEAARQQALTYSPEARRLAVDAAGGRDKWASLGWVEKLEYIEVNTN